jgi:quinone-modifying oxidoreductase subunit QmoA
MSEKGKILVVGGGISGISSAIEASEAGYEVILVEKNPYLGGRVAQFNQYFPKLCPPYCGLEINYRRLRSNSKVSVYTQAEVESVEGSAGNFVVTIKVNPRKVNKKCVACDECVKVCPVPRDNDFNYGMDKNAAIYLPHALAYPMRYVIDTAVCLGEDCAKCVSACKYDAIDLNMSAETLNVKVSAIIYATGWNPYNATKMDNLGFGKFDNVITNVMMERIAAPNGPTNGKIVRPSDFDKKDEAKVNSVAFVQCAGSRDENHLPYCSAICCLASLKQASMIREQYPDAQINIFYIDIRANGKYELFYQKFQDDQKIIFTKGKIAKITENPDTKDLTVVGEDTLSAQKVMVDVNMVVLAAGMEPSTIQSKVPSNVTYDEFGFIIPDPEKPGIYAAGVARRPSDVARAVQTATGCALSAIQQAQGGN